MLLCAGRWGAARTEMIECNSDLLQDLCGVLFRVGAVLHEPLEEPATCRHLHDQRRLAMWIGLVGRNPEGVEK